jgi:fatty acid desaturase
MEHHLVPEVPWYHQLMLHHHLRSLLTPQQRRQFLVPPVIGWPMLWWRLLSEPTRIEQHGKSNRSSAPGY